MRDLLFKYTNRNSRFLVVDNTLMHYRDEGSGEVLVMLHGAFSSLHTFNPWVRLLKDKYRIVRLDLMGFGLTGPNENGDYSIPNHIRVLKKFLNILEINKCTLVGSSLGGWIAWEFCLRYPQRVHRLALIDSAGFLNEDNIPLPFKLAKAPIFGRVIRYVVRRGVLEQFVKQVYYDSAKVNTSLVDRYYDLFAREGNSDAFIKLVNTKHKDNTHNLRRINQPTLVLWGEEDSWIPVTTALLFKDALPQAKVKIYPDVGHIPMEEIPEQSVNDFLEFLARHPIKHND